MGLGGAVNMRGKVYPHGLSVHSSIVYSLALFLSCLFLSTSCWANDCSFPPIKLEEIIRGSDIIFSGKTIGSGDGRGGYALFQVSKVWKGTPITYVVVRNSHACFNFFWSDTEYLVFANLNNNGKLREYDYYCDQFGFTRLLENSSKTLVVLGDGYLPRNPTTLEKLRLIYLLNKSSFRSGILFSLFPLLLTGMYFVFRFNRTH